MKRSLKDRWTSKGHWYELAFTVAVYIPVVIFANWLSDSQWVRLPIYFLWLFAAEGIYKKYVAPYFNLPVYIPLYQREKTDA